MKKYLITILILFTFVFIIYLIRQEKNSEYGFFAWMDSYIATEVNAEDTVAITLFYDKKPFEVDDVSGMAFSDIENEIIITGFEVINSDLKDKGYSSYVISLNYLAEQIGIFETSGIHITLKSNEIINYPVGKWTFDIADASGGLVDTWESMVVTSNSEKFPYEYSLLNPDAIITKIYYGNNLYVSNENNPINNGAIDLSEVYYSPVVYIKSKIEVLVDNEYKIDYGKGCYCGAMNSKEDIIKISKEKNSIQ